MKALLDLTDELTCAQVFLERVENTLGEVADDYFNETVNNPTTPKGKENIALFFDENRVKAHIARDYAIRMRKTLANMEGLIKSATENAGRESEYLNPIVRLERLSIAAARNGKGQEWVAILKKHGVTDYAAFPLSKYSALEADMLNLVKEEAAHP